MNTHIQYPYHNLIRKIMNSGRVGPSRMGELKQLTNQFLSFDMKDICRLPYNSYRNENLDFILRYMESTFDALPESYMLELAPKNAQNLEQLELSYGEILSTEFSREELLKVRPNSKRQVKLFYNRETSKHNIPPCSLGYQFNSDGKYLDMIVYSRSIDVYYGLTNDLIVFFSLMDMSARYNGLIPRNFSIAFGNVHYYTEKTKKIHEWLQSTSFSNSIYNTCNCRAYEKWMDNKEIYLRNKIDEELW